MRPGGNCITRATAGDYGAGVYKNCTMDSTTSGPRVDTRQAPAMFQRKAETPSKRRREEWSGVEMCEIRPFPKETIEAM